MKKSSIFISLVILCSLAALFTGCAKQEKPTENMKIDIDQALQIFGSQVDAQPKITSETALAKVNGEVITHGQLQIEMKKLAQSLPKTLAPEQLQQAQQQIANKALQNLIQNKLIREAIGNTKSEASQEEIDAQINVVKQQLQEGQTLESELNKQKINEEQYRVLVGQQISLNNFFKGISSAATQPSEADIKKFYDENTDRFTRPAGVEARHILFKATTEDPGELFVKKKKAARAALARVTAGEAFDKLIIELSEGPNAQNGGVLGFLQKGNTAPEIAEHVFDLAEGEHTGVVRTQYGFHIIQVTKIHAPLTVAFEDAKANIEKSLFQQSKQKLIEDHVTKLREKADIEIIQN